MPRLETEVLIGRPVDARVYILDPSRQPVPIGAVGELYVGGPGLALGYLNQPELTAARFIPSPFEEGARLYRTGDLARYLPDGNIEYVGRNDFQVKVRGFRVELGEIEHRLLRCSGIRQAVALARGAYLIGYYVADRQLDESAILEELARHLPDYMVPARLVYLERLPLGPTGKVDRKALPDPGEKRAETYLAPRDRYERHVCDIVAEVLGCPPSAVGIRANFFRLGGNSLLAIQLAHRLSRFFAAQLPVAEIFLTKTMEQLARSIEKIASKNILLPAAVGLSEYPLSFSQERLWFIEQYEQGTTAYHLPRLVKLRDEVSTEALTKAIQSIVERHEVLRTFFVRGSDGVERQVVQDAKIEVRRRLCPDVGEFEKRLERDVNAPFDLRNEYPIRVCLYEVPSSGGERYLLVNLHHIASDGWSTDIFQKEWIAFYDHYHRGRPLALPALAIQYKDFAAWQRGHLSGEEYRGQLEYWRGRLANCETLSLVPDKRRPPEVDYAGASFTFDFSEEVSAKVRELARARGCSLYTVLLAGFYVLLNKYSGQEDIVVGTPIANRHYESTKDLIGFFVNLLAQRERLDVDQPVTQLIDQIRGHLAEAQRHQDIPFEKLIEELRVERDTARHPLFQVLFAVQSFGRGEKAFSEYYEGVDISPIHAVTRFDLELSIDDSRVALEGRVSYATSLFEEATIRRWMESYESLLMQMVMEPNKPIECYQAMSPVDFRRVVYDWNQTAEEYPSEKTLHGLFEEQARRTPDFTALVHGETRLTYRELDERANRLAHFLLTTYALSGDDLVALCISRSPEMIVAILGVLKAGAAYVPIDPAYPEERTRYVLRDTGAKAFLLDSLNEQRKGDSSALVLDSPEVRRALEGQPSTSPAPVVNGRNLAYVIYTSGTTGHPKGVMVEHRSVGNTLSSLKKVYELASGERLAAFTNYAFDVSVSEIFSALIAGAELHLLAENVRRDATLISEYVRSHAIHYLYLPPVLLALFPREEYPSLRGIVYAGEPCDPATGRYWSQRCRLFNYYGPTEATIYALGKRVVDGDVHLIGRPLCNTSAYVLDGELNPVPIGAVGELYLGGAGLARGYLNASDLTTEKFIPSPFESGARMYKTGDLVRYLPDGNVEYIGRNDFQVKVRGFRVELGEIEQRLLRFPGIRQAVVVARNAAKESDHHCLVGYYVADGPLAEEALLEELSRHLPDYMVPARLVWMETLPLTTTGKLDRASLPRPDEVPSTAYVAPRNVTEEGVCRVFAELFGCPAGAIGVQAGFFRLGGNSLLAIQVAHRLSRTFDVHLPVAEIFRAKTIAQLAKSIDSITSRNLVIPKAEGVAQFPLSFAQERLWFIEQYEQGTAAYHLPRLAKVREGVSREALLRALGAIVDRHEAWRTVFLQDDSGGEYQVVRRAPVDILVRHCATFAEYEAALEDDVNTPFDLRKEYPVRARLYEWANEIYLLVNMHHVASDGWSIDIFQRELVAFYEHYALGKPLSLPPLPIQYKDFAVWQRRYLSGTELESQLQYWRARLEGSEPLRLPTDKPRPAKLGYAGRSFFFYLTPELSSQLRELARRHDRSLYVVLLSGFYFLLHRCSDQTDIVVGTPTANRHYDSIKDLIGSFVNMIAQRERLDVTRSILDLMAQVQGHLVEAQRHQDLPFEKLLQGLRVARDIRFHPLFQVMFSVQSFGIKEENYSHYLESIDITDRHPTARFDLACFVSTATDAFKGLITYSTDLFEEPTVRKWLTDYVGILTQMVETPEKPLSDYGTITRGKKPEIQAPVSTIEAEVEFQPPRNETERQIREIFAEIFSLSAESIGIRANFFQLGGTSITAMRAALRLSKLFGRPFPLIELFRNPTIEKLARASTAEAAEILVPLREGRTDTPLFMIPGGSGDEFVLAMSIAKHLRFDDPVYGIRSRVLDPDWSVPNSLSEHAKAVFESVRKVQPRGPYYFLGECIGGALAVQLQQLAEERGEPAGTVLLLNSRPVFAPAPKRSMPSEALAKLRYYFYRVKNFCLTVESPVVKYGKISRFLKKKFLSSDEALAKSDRYYHLLHSGKPVRLRSALQLLLSFDETTSQSYFESWKASFRNETHLHLYRENQSTERRSRIIAGILDKILN